MNLTKYAIENQSFICELPKRKRCVAHCKQHQFSIKQTQKNKVNLDTTVNFCPKVSRGSLPPQSTHPQFINDGLYYTQAFVLGVDKKQIASNLKQELLDHQKIAKQFNQKTCRALFPKPNPKHTICSVCKFDYGSSYYFHIMSEQHKRRIQKSLYNEYIVEISNLFSELHPSKDQQISSPFRFADHIIRKMKLQEQSSSKSEENEAETHSKEKQQEQQNIPSACRQRSNSGEAKDEQTDENNQKKESIMQQQDTISVNNIQKAVENKQIQCQNKQTNDFVQLAKPAQLIQDLAPKLTQQTYHKGDSKEEEEEEASSQPKRKRVNKQKAPFEDKASQSNEKQQVKKPKIRKNKPKHNISLEKTPRIDLYFSSQNNKSIKKSTEFPLKPLTYQQKLKLHLQNYQLQKKEERMIEQIGKKLEEKFHKQEAQQLSKVIDFEWDQLQFQQNELSAQLDEQTFKQMLEPSKLQTYPSILQQPSKLLTSPPEPIEVSSDSYHQTDLSDQSEEQSEQDVKIRVHICQQLQHSGQNIKQKLSRLPPAEKNKRFTESTCGQSSPKTSSIQSQDANINHETKDRVNKSFIEIKDSEDSSNICRKREPEAVIESGSLRKKKLTETGQHVDIYLKPESMDASSSVSTDIKSQLKQKLAVYAALKHSR